MIRYIDKGTARQHLTDRLMESALNNVGIKADADEVFRDIAVNRLPVWIDELQTHDVQEVRIGRWIYHQLPKCVECSVCHTHWDVFMNYCPNCGTGMYNATQHTECVGDALDALDEVEE